MTGIPVVIYDEALEPLKKMLISVEAYDTLQNGRRWTLFLPQFAPRQISEAADVPASLYVDTLELTPKLLHLSYVHHVWKITCRHQDQPLLSRFPDFPLPYQNTTRRNPHEL